MDYNLNYPTNTPQPLPSQMAPPVAPSGGLPKPSGSQILSTAASVVNPLAFGANIAGTAFDLYGKYKARQQARKNYELAKEMWEKQQAQEEQDRAIEQGRQDRQEAYYGGQYSQDLLDNLGSMYGGFRQGGQ